MSEPMADKLCMIQHLTPPEREALAAILARVMDTMTERYGWLWA